MSRHIFFGTVSFLPHGGTSLRLTRSPPGFFMPAPCRAMKPFCGAAAALACLAGCGQMPAGGYASPYMHEPYRLGHLEAETAYVTPRHEFVLGDVEYYREFNDRNKYTTTAKFEFGAMDRLMFDADIPYVSVFWNDGHNTAGLGDIRTGAKYQVYKDDDLALAVRVDVYHPSGLLDSDTGEGLYQTEAGMAASVRLHREKFAAHAFAGVRWRESSGPDSGFVTLAAEYRTPLTPDEMYLQLGFSGYYGQGNTPVEIIPGVHVRFNELPWQVPIAFQVALGVPIGLDSDASDWGVRLQLDAKF
jgi:hypothetical protein